MEQFYTKKTEDMDFHTRRPCGDLLYEEDILYGKIHISQIPYEYRTGTAYIYAFRAVRERETDREKIFTKKKIVEQLLLNDIMRAYGNGDRCKAEELEMLHWAYFSDKTIMWG